MKVSVLMPYTVQISSDEQADVYECDGTNDQDALIYAGKVVEANSAKYEPEAAVSVLRDGLEFGPLTTVGELTKREPSARA